jgi:hypothetical protein
VGGSIGFVKGLSGGVRFGYDPCASRKPWKWYRPSTWRWVHPYVGVGTVLGAKAHAAVMSGQPSGGWWVGNSLVGGIPAWAGVGPAGKIGANMAQGTPDVGGGIGWGLGYFAGFEHTW